VSTIANTLYVTTEGAYLHKDHETVVVSIDREVRLRVPLLHLGSVACFGRVSVSPELMAALAEGGIHTAFFSPNGRFLARVEGIPGGNVLLRRAQHRTADDPGKAREIARAEVAGKIWNERQVLVRARRDATTDSAKERLGGAVDRLSQHLRALEVADQLDVIRGLEGIAARDYFDVFDLLIKRDDEAFRFAGRSRRPPLDRINALLSFGYALLLQDCAGAAAGIGLDPAVGFLHQDRPGRLSLALDLMEELRTPVVDRLVLALVNRNQIGPTDLQQEVTGGWRLTDAGRKTFLVAYQEAKAVEVRHEFLDATVPWGRIPHLQAALLARTLRGDLEVYPPFALR
jgi:CRISPR-associated protein Cas1